MAFDQHRNLAIGTVLTPPSPAASGTTVVVAGGDGARFPVPPFNATLWPATAIPTPVTAEIVRVTAIAGDTFTLIRGQEGTAVRTIVGGDLIAATITAKAFADLESGANFPSLNTPGAVWVGDSLHFPTAVPGILNGSIFKGSINGLTVAATPGSTNDFALVTPTGSAVIAKVPTGTANVVFGGSLTSLGLALISGWTLTQGSVNAGNNFFYQKDGTVLQGRAGTAAVDLYTFYNGSGAVGRIETSGSGTTYWATSDARLKQDRGVVRTDATLAILRGTVVHDFTWTVDGTPGRGVFAQEAQSVAPFAVSAGTDETDAAGRLVKPWAVDYTKYVPDLLVGWQTHDAQLLTLAAANAALEARIATLEAAAPADGPSLFAALADWLRARIQGWRTPAPIGVTG